MAPAGPVTTNSVTIDRGGEIRFHRARKAWSCAGADGMDCANRIAPGEQYAELRPAGLAKSAFGTRYCLGCAESLRGVQDDAATPPVPMRGQHDEGTEQDDWWADRVRVRRRQRLWVRVVRFSALLCVWVVAILVTVAVLYATFRFLDWFLQVMQEPPGRDRQTL